MCTNLSDDQCAIGLHKNVCVSAACSKEKLSRGKSEPGVLAEMWRFLWEYCDFPSGSRWQLYPSSARWRLKGDVAKAVKRSLWNLLVLVRSLNGDYSKGTESFPHWLSYPGKNAWIGLAQEGSPSSHPRQGFWQRSLRRERSQRWQKPLVTYWKGMVSSARW